MSTELIKEICVRDGSVFLCSHSKNDDSPFRHWKCESLTAVYQLEGQTGLDREIFRMLCEYAQLYGSHQSLQRYYYALKAPLASVIKARYHQAVSEKYERLSEADIRSLYVDPTDLANDYLQFDARQSDLRYTMLAALCLEYESRRKKHLYEEAR